MRERTYELVTDRKPYYAGEDRPVPVYCREEHGSAVVMDQVLKGIGKDLLSESFIIGDIDGRGERRLSSLSELRNLERESEIRHRNGEGQIVNFRDFSQDRNNRERNSLSGSSYETGKSVRAPRRVTSSGLPINIRTTR